MSNQDTWKEGPLGQWQEAFAADPDGVLARTLVGGWYFGSLNPVEPEQLLWDMVRHNEEGNDFPEHLDRALATWIAGNASALDRHKRAMLEPTVAALVEKGYRESQTALTRVAVIGVA